MKKLYRLFIVLTILLSFSYYKPVSFAEEPSFSPVEINANVKDELDAAFSKYQFIALYEAKNITTLHEVTIDVSESFIDRPSVRLYYLSDEGPVGIIHHNFSFNITDNGYYALVDLKAVAIKISQMPKEKKFPVNGPRDYSGLKVLVTLDDGSTYETTNYQIGKTTIRDIFYDSVEIFYEGCETALEVQVTPVGCNYATVQRTTISLMAFSLIVIIFFRRHKYQI